MIKKLLPTLYQLLPKDVVYLLEEDIDFRSYAVGGILGVFIFIALYCADKILAIITCIIFNT